MSRQEIRVDTDPGRIEGVTVREQERFPGPETFDSGLSRRVVVRIRPSSRWTAVNLKDVWEYRELFLFLIWRDLKVRYRQTLLGGAWVIAQPLSTMLVFAFVFGRVIAVPSDGIPYPLFAFAGLVPWTFFSSSVMRAGNSVVGSAHLITKVYFPRLIIPSAAVAGGLVDFAIALLLLAPLMLYYGFAGSPSLLLLPLLILLTTCLALGIGMLTAALNVKYRDIGYILPFLLQIGMFASPIIYPASMIPAEWRWAFMLNPMTGIIEGYRTALFATELSLVALAVSAVLTFTTLGVGAYAFRRMEKDFADVV